MNTLSSSILDPERTNATSSSSIPEPEPTNATSSSSILHPEPTNANTNPPALSEQLQGQRSKLKNALPKPMKNSVCTNVQNIIEKYKIKNATEWFTAEDNEIKIIEYLNQNGQDYSLQYKNPFAILNCKNEKEDEEEEYGGKKSKKSKKKKQKKNTRRK